MRKKAEIPLTRFILRQILPHQCRHQFAFHQRLKFRAVHKLRHLPKFFAASNKLDRVQKDGQAFRKIARETFEHTAPVFINACLQRDKAGIPKSRTVIAWDHVKPLDQVPA